MCAKAGADGQQEGGMDHGGWRGGRGHASPWSRAFTLGFRPEHMRGFELHKGQSNGGFSFGEAEGWLARGLRWSL